MAAVSSARNNTNFSLIEFVHYFREHDTLEISADQPLIIRDASAVRDDFSMEAQDDLGRRFIETINKILAVLAKTGSFHYEQGTSRIVTGEHLILTHSAPFTLNTKSASIGIQAATLFKVMVATGIHRVTIAPGQDLTLHNATLLSPLSTETVAFCLLEGVPKGWSLFWHFPPFNVQVGTIECGGHSHPTVRLSVPKTSEAMVIGLDEEKGSGAAASSAPGSP